MCGLFGGLDITFDKRQVRDGLHSRGPDSFNVWSNGRFTCSQSRLIIFGDEKSGAQPCKSKKGNIITFNGELYSFYDKRTESFGMSEVDILADMYDRFGLSVFENIDGMYAITIYDTEQQCLYLSRDQFGMKPLYYCRVGNSFRYSSSQLLLAKQLNRGLDMYSIAFYSRFGCQAAPKSMFYGISSLEPGRVLRIDSEGIVSSYDVSDWTRSREVEDIGELLEYGVRSSCQISGKASVLFSGGIDSSLLSFYAMKHYKDVDAITIRFDGVQNTSEIKQAQLVSDRIGIEHSIFDVCSQDLSVLVDKYISSIDHPSNESLNSFIATYFAGLSSRCALTGTGLDEIFFGYTHMHKPFSLKERIMNALRELTCETLYDNVHTRYLQQRSLATPKILKSSKIDYDAALEHLQNMSGKTNEDLDESQQVEIINYLSQHLLLDADTTSMANSVELRPVFLTKGFVKRAISLISEINDPKRIYNKRLLRNQFVSIFGFEPCPKVGFELPYKHFSKVCDEYFQDLLHSRIMSIVFPQFMDIEKDRICVNRSSWHIFVLLAWLDVNGYGR